MKPKKPAEVRPVPEASPAISPGRIWFFRLVAISLPLVLLGVAELGLRIGGYGYDPSFFKVERDAQGKKWLIDNEHFTLRFFPPELARWPCSVRVAAEKPKDVLRIYVLGESAAMGDPQPSLGAWRILSILLREKFPNQKFEVVNLGITAINSHVIRPLALELAARGQGDLWLIYMGNNEMVGPFGASTIFGWRAPPMGVVRVNLALQRSRVGQLAAALMRKARGKPAGESWGGMRMFLQNQIQPGDPRRERVYRNFERNLRDIVQAGNRSGARVLLSTVSVNLRDCPPFGSLGTGSLPAGDRAKAEALQADAISLQTNKQFNGAVSSFTEALKFSPELAECQFRLGQCLLQQTNASAAREHFQRACDLDAMPFRADTRINGAIKTVGRELAGHGLELCDAGAALAAVAPDGIAGDESFFEHVHFNFDGNYRLAKVWAEHIAKLLPRELQQAAKAGWASQADCEREIGLSDWNRVFVISAVIARMGNPPLANQFTNPERLQVLQQALDFYRARQSQSNEVALARAGFETAVSHAPTDAFLHENHANFLEAIEDKPRALAEYLKIREISPQDFYSALQAGRMLVDAVRLSDAKPLLRQAVAQRPPLPEPWFELGRLHLAEGSYREALECFDRAARLRPSAGNYLAFKAKALSQLNRREESIEAYRQALKLQPGSWQGHFELGGELAAAGRVAEAIEEYSKAVGLNPRHAIARVNLGVVLVGQNRLDEAIQQFQIALELDPANAAAKDYLRQVTQRRDQKRRL